MDILILNSGIGSRIRDSIGQKPKALIEVYKGKPLLVYQIETILSSTNSNIIITTGYKKNEIVNSVEKRFSDRKQISFINNPLFLTTNYIYSIYLCLPYLCDDIILMHGDLFFSKNVFLHLLRQKKSVVTIDSTQPLSEKDFKAKIIDGRVMEIATTLESERCYNCQPLYRLEKSDWLQWADNIKVYCENQKTSVYAEEALNELLNNLSLYPYDLRGEELCMEIDTPEDLRKIQRRLHNYGRK